MVELILGDCMEAIGALEDGSIDAVITDPPYGISYKSGRSDRFEVIAGDDVTQVDFIGAVLPKLRDTGCMAVFSRWDVQQKVADAMSAAGLDVTSVIVWDKDSHGMGDLKKGFAPGYETIVFGAMPGFSFPAHRPKNIIRVKKVGGELAHPNEKPIPLLRWIIEAVTRPGDVVLDCYMGSGTTGVACKQIGRNFVGMEIDPHYYSVAQGRIERGVRDPVQQMMI